MKFLFRDGTPVVHGSLDGPTPPQNRKALLATMKRKPKRKPIVRSKARRPAPIARVAEPVTAFDDRSRPQLLGDLARRLA